MPGTGVRFGMQTLKTNENSSINSITEDCTCIDQVIIYFFLSKNTVFPGKWWWLSVTH